MQSFGSGPGAGPGSARGSARGAAREAVPQPAREPGPQIVVAADSFKEAVTAARACEAIAEGVRRAHPRADLVLVPMADGGEGTARVVRAALGAAWVEVAVVDPLGRPRTAGYAWEPGRRVAVVELAQASGLALLRPGERDPLRTTTRGFGQLIADALDRGARELVLGIGGSATNDAGTGMLQALGARLLDARGAPVGPGAGGLRELAVVDLAPARARLRGVRVRVACDVRSPLLGPDGATRTFGPQKGLPPGRLAEVEEAVARWADLVEADAGRPVRDLPGAGAAGGVGAALLALGLTLDPGVELVADLVGLREALAGADLAITGEGAFDAQSRAGKVPFGVARLAAAAGVPVVVLAGRVAPDLPELAGAGIVAAVQITPPGTPLAAALAATTANLAAAAERVVRGHLGDRGEAGTGPPTGRPSIGDGGAPGPATRLDP